MRLVVGSDHAGFSLKAELIAYAESHAHRSGRRQLWRRVRGRGRTETPPNLQLRPIMLIADGAARPCCPGWSRRPLRDGSLFRSS